MAEPTYKSVRDIDTKQRMLFVSATSIEAAKTSPIAYSTSASLDFSKDQVDVSNKTDGGWSTQKGGKKSASISTEVLYSKKKGAVGESMLFDAYDKDTDLYFVYGFVTVTESEDGTGSEIEFDATRDHYTGMLAINGLSLSSDNGDVAKYSVDAASQGKVTHVNGTE